MVKTSILVTFSLLLHCKIDPFCWHCPLHGQRLPSRSTTSSPRVPRTGCSSSSFQDSMSRVILSLETSSQLFNDTTFRFNLRHWRVSFWIFNHLFKPVCLTCGQSYMFKNMLWHHFDVKNALQVNFLTSQTRFRVLNLGTRVSQTHPTKEPWDLVLTSQEVCSLDGFGKLMWSSRIVSPDLQRSARES